MNGEIFQIVTAVLYVISGLAFLFVLIYLRTFIKRLLGNDSEIDPVAEAEIYVALGRKNQAIEVLNQALLDTPNRVYIMKKLDELQGFLASVPVASATYSGKSSKAADLNYLMMFNASNSE